VNKTALKAHLAIFMANVFYGINYSVAKEIMPVYIHSYGLTIVRILGAATMFWIFTSFGEQEKIDKKDRLRLLLAGLLGVALNQVLFLTGLNLSTPIDASLIMTTIPMWVLVVAAFMMQEHITPAKIGGIIAGFAGASLLILGNGKIDFGSDNMLGNLMLLTNSFSYAIYLVIAKPLLQKYKPFTVMKWVFTAGLVYITPVGFNQFIDIDWSAMPWWIVIAVIYVVVFTTFFAYLFNIYGLRHVKPSTVSIYIYSQPLIAGIVAIILGKDSLTAIKIIAGVLVFAGVYLVSRQGGLNQKGILTFFFKPIKFGKNIFPWNNSRRIPPAE
jgi:drug/metabolite transporter (DMT)-like permease